MNKRQIPGKANKNKKKYLVYQRNNSNSFVKHIF